MRVYHNFFTVSREKNIFYKVAKMNDKDKLFNKFTSILTIICVLITSVAGVFILNIENTDNSVIIKSKNSEITESKIDNTEFGTYNPDIYGLININTADKQTLMILEGIGEKKADAIIEYRSATPFKKVQDITKVKGIGNTIYENIKGIICVE